MPEHTEYKRICHKLTFSPPGVSSRLSAPPGHLPHQTVLLRDTVELLAAWAPWFSSPLAQDGGVVVIRGQLTTGHLVGVSRGMALAQGEGLLGLQQVRTPGGGEKEMLMKKKMHKERHKITCCVCVCYSLCCFSPQKVVHHIWIRLQQTHQNLVLQIGRHLPQKSETRVKIKNVPHYKTTLGCRSYRGSFHSQEQLLL